MAERKPVFLDLTGEEDLRQMETTDSITLGGLTMGGNIDMNSAGKIVNANAATADGDVLVYGQSSANLAGLTIDTADLVMSGQKITGIADGDSGSQDVPSVAQVEALVATGNVFKEAVHASSQLIDGASGGIRALEVIHFDGQPVAGDTVVLKNATLTRTYTFVANQGAESAATDVSIETDADTAMQRLITRVNADVGNTQWELFYHTGGETGNEVHVTEKTTPVSTLSASRIYGTWTTQADFQVVPFSDGASVIKYNEGVAETASTTDPGSGRFGLSRAEADLVDGEVHLALDVNAQFSWEDSAQSWNQISGVGAIPDATSGSGGDVKGIVTFDSDKGLSVTTGIAEVTLAASSGIKFSTGSLAIEPTDFAGTGLEDDGADNLRLAAQGNGIAGGAGSTLSVDSDTETGGNTQGVSVTANGVGLDVSAIAGTGLEADGSANLRLAAQGNGIAGGAGSTLSVDPDSETGGNTAPVTVGANGVGLDVSALAGDGIQADGSARLALELDASGSGLELTGTTPAKTLGIQLEASNPTLQIDGSNQLGAKLDGTKGLQAGTGGIEVKVDSSTITFDGSGNLQAVGATEAERVENTLTTATDATTNGDPVYINGNDTVGKARADTPAKTRVIGVIRTGAGAAGATPQVVSLGPCAGVLSGATANDKYYLQSTGGIAASLPPANETVVRVGFAKSATDLWVDLRYIGRRAAA